MAITDVLIRCDDPDEQDKIAAQLAKLLLPDVKLIEDGPDAPALRVLAGDSNYAVGRARELCRGAAEKAGVPVEHIKFDGGQGWA